MKKKAAKSTRKIGGSTYNKKSCHTSKAAAKKSAESYRKKGLKARVIDKCVYVGPQAKKRRSRKRA